MAHDGQFLARRPGVAWAAWLSGGALVGAAVAAGVDPVVTSARYVVVVWAVAEVARSRCRGPEAAPARLAWLLAWLTLAAHTAVALHVRHGWSHARAYDQTEAASGFGPGVFVNYAVVLVWGADAVGRMAKVRWPRGAGVAVRAAVAFVMFNAALVYGTPAGKLLGAAAFAAAAWASLRPRNGPTPGAPPGVP